MTTTQGRELRRARSTPRHDLTDLTAEHVTRGALLYVARNDPDADRRRQAQHLLGVSPDQQ